MWDFIKRRFSDYKDLNTFNFERVPIVCPVKDDVILNKDGSFTMVIKLEGYDYNGVTESKFASLRRARESAIRKAGSDVIFSAYTLRFRQNASINFHEAPDPIANTVVQKWGNSFENCFVNHHYVAITNKKGIANALKKNQLERIGNIVNFIVESLKDFKPRIIKDDELVGFFCSILNGRYYDQVQPINDVFANYLSTTPIEFYEKKSHFTYLDTGKLASFLTIKNLPEYIHQAVFDALIRRNIEMIITQHSSQVQNDEAINRTKRELRLKERFSTGHMGMITSELREVLELLTANRTSLSDHCMSIQVISRDEEVHKADLTEVEALFSQNNFVISKNTLSKEPLYWSQFPSKMASNVRIKRLNSSNVTESVTFSSSGIGETSCTWGDHPLCSFSTIDGNIFNFIPHVDGSQDAKGHLLIIGGTGSGKTTFTTFIKTFAQTYPGMKIIAFDRLKGMEIATRMQGGTYIDFADSDFGINPFDLENKKENVQFLVDYITDLVDANEAEKMTIQKNTPEILNYEKDINKNIEEIPYLFGTDEDPLFKKFKVWMKGGAYEAYHSTKKGSFNFDSTLTTFDASLVLENPKILGLFSSYLTHQFFSQMNGDPRIFFVDELKNFLEAPTFLKLISRIINEIRKRNGIFIGAMQDIDQIWQNEAVKKDFNFSNFAKFILYPVAGNMNEEAYKKGLGLSDDELYWIKNTDPATRQIMIKKNGGSSTIIHCDLSYLGEHLSIYNSSSTNIIRLQELMNEYPSDYKQRYLDEQKERLLN